MLYLYITNIDTHKYMLMLIKSFIAFPAQGQKERMISDLTNIEGCEVMPAENEDIVILIIEAAEEETEKELIEKVNNTPSVDQISLVAGYNETMKNK